MYGLFVYFCLIFQRRSSTTVRRCVPEPVPTICATPSPRPRCRIRTNPWLGSTSPNVRKKGPHLLHQQSLQCPPPPQLHHAPFSLDSHQKYTSRWRIFFFNTKNDINITHLHYYWMPCWFLNSNSTISPSLMCSILAEFRLRLLNNYVYYLNYSTLKTFTLKH